MPGCSPTRILLQLLSGEPIERLTAEEREDFEHVLSLDGADEDFYERLGGEYPEEDGDATRARSRVDAISAHGLDRPPAGAEPAGGDPADSGKAPEGREQWVSMTFCLPSFQ
jgi:hypothetical protein